MDIYKMMKLLSDPSRMKILFVLYNTESYVQDIVDVTELSQANVSKHLKKLRELGIVENNLEGNRVLYSLSDLYLNSCIIFKPLMDMYVSHPDGITLINRINEEN